MSISPHTTQRRRHGRRPVQAVLLACLLAACGVGLCFVLSAPAHAADPTIIVATKQPTTLPELRQAADKVQRQVAALDDRLEVVVEDWDQTESQLAAIQAQLGAVRLQLAQQQDDLAHQQNVLGSHLAWMYKLGDYGLLDELLSGGSLNDAAARIEFVRRLNEQDRQLRDGFLATVRRVDALEATIAEQRDQAMVVQQQADAERATISDKLAERQAILDGLNGRIKKILDERSRRDALAAGRLGREALAQIGSINGTAAQLGVIHAALRFLGVPYVWGGATRAASTAPGSCCTSTPATASCSRTSRPIRPRWARRCPSRSSSPPTSCSSAAPSITW